MVQQLKKYDPMTLAKQQLHTEDFNHSFIESCNEIFDELLEDRIVIGCKLIEVQGMKILLSDELLEVVYPKFVLNP